MENRFIRLPRGEILGFKIATRLQVNPRLPYREGNSEDRYLSSLSMLFGAPDQIGDGRFTYSIEDKQNHVKFEAFVGNSGPSYGGTVHHFEDLNTGALKEKVFESLKAFDLLLEETFEKNKN